MICTFIINGISYENCFTFNTSVKDGEYYCYTCECNLTRDKFAYRATEKVVKAWASLDDKLKRNPPKEHCVLLGTCFKCVEDFARYGCD